MIGILGGYGYVGIYATRFIKNYSKHKIRIGGRNFEKVDSKIRDEFSDAEWTKVNAKKDEDLNSFFSGCDCMIDATSLPHQEVQRLDDFAQRKQIPIVHLGLNGFEKAKSNISIIYGAGSIPGLSGLVPQYLAQTFDNVNELEFCFGACGTMSPAAAKDYLDGICNAENKSMVYWNQGKLEPFIPSNSDYEFFDRKFSCYKLFPYFDEESAAVTNKIDAKTSRWQMCFAGRKSLAELDHARTNYKKDPQKTIEDFCTANRLDMFGEKEEAIFYCSISGTENGIEKKKILRLSGIAPRENTGETAAAAALAILENKTENKKQLLGESNLFNSVLQFITKDSRINLEIYDPDEESEGEI